MISVDYRLDKKVPARTSIALAVNDRVVRKAITLYHRLYMDLDERVWGRLESSLYERYPDDL